VYAVLRGIIDRIVLVAAIIVAGCIPSFIAQYRQRLGGRLDQVLQDLALFQEIANRFHNGSMQALIQHHLASTDRTFYDEGLAIQTMMQTAERLRQAVQALNTDLAHQVTYLLTRADTDIVRATWNVFQPSFTLTLESVVFAAVVGIAIWLVFLGLWHAIAYAVQGPRTRRQRRSRFAS
jgi:hypothetical protein